MERVTADYPRGNMGNLNFAYRMCFWPVYAALIFGEIFVQLFKGLIQL